ncbi:MAG: methyltransferase [Anaerolineales bacterium]|nr:methyltransferase [Anaerolineales bacterium]
MYDSFVRYLTAKKSVDDRALNQSVWSALAAAIQTRQAGSAEPLRVLELGAGIGTMIERVLTWKLLPEAGAPVTYTAIDAEAGNIAAAELRLANAPAWLELQLQTADVFEFAAQTAVEKHFDLLIANAFLDLVDTARVLPQFTRLLRPGGLAYFTINFDGATILQPEIDPPFDAAIEAIYHLSMDERITNGEPSGDSRTGRHLFGRLAEAGIKVLAAGSSDWVVHAVDGIYPEDEAYFLHFIVETMHGALREHPALAGERFEEWITTRHAQIDRGELVYIAHQLDFLGVRQSTVCQSTIP